MGSDMDDLMKKLVHIKIDGSRINSVEQALVEVLKSASDVMKTKDNMFHAGCHGCDNEFETCCDCQYYGPDWRKQDMNSVRFKIREQFYKDGKFDRKPNPKWRKWKFWELEYIWPNLDELEVEIYLTASKDH